MEKDIEHRVTKLETQYETLNEEVKTQRDKTHQLSDVTGKLQVTVEYIIEKIDGVFSGQKTLEDKQETLAVKFVESFSAMEKSIKKDLGDKVNTMWYGMIGIGIFIGLLLTGAKLLNLI